MRKQDDYLIVDNAPYNKPEADEVVIKTKAVAFNPADVGIQKMGIIIDSYPAILGCDAAGIVEEVGSDIKDFKIGDRVIGQAQPLAGGIYKYSAFQQYVVLKMPSIAKIPDEISWTDATVLPLGINTAASCLFQENTLALHMPPGQAGRGKTLLIWGASSSVGSCGVQLAAAAGYEVFGVASKKNHDFVKSIGAARTFDQSDPDIVENICTALKNKTCVGAYDAISKEKTLHTICDILQKSSERKLIVSVMPNTEALAKHNVIIKTNFGASSSKISVGLQIWRVYLEPALASGALQCKPPAEVVGHGLENVQKAIDLLAQGVSAKKLVVTI
jgi:NADPH:quinone reductase-like Zn-dependent oxidoreductase